MAATVKRKWCLNRYARLIYEEKNVPDGDRGAIVSTNEIKKSTEVGTWKQFASEDNDLVLSYLEAEHFLLTNNDTILESFSLINSKKWIKGVARGDCLMIIQNLEQAMCRRFRIRFSDGGGLTGITHCEECAKILSQYFPIKCGETEKHLEVSTSRVSAINQEVLDAVKLRRAFATAVPMDHMPEMVMLSLSDPSFPAYVEAVENVLRKIKK